MELRVSKNNAKAILVGIFSGLVLGVLARLWMRWISTDREFSWNGTIFIVSSFTIAIAIQPIVSLLRRRFNGKKAKTLLRIGGAIFSLPIFVEMGAIMFPTVALAGIALWSTKLSKRFRGILFALSLIGPFFISRNIISDSGWTIATLGRILLFILIYNAVIVLLRPTIMLILVSEKETKTSNRCRDILKVVLVIIVGALLFFFTIGLYGT